MPRELDSELIQCAVRENGAHIYSPLIRDACTKLVHCQIPAHVFVIVVPTMPFRHLCCTLLNIVERERTLGRLHGILLHTSVDGDTMCSAKVWDDMMGYFRRHRRLKRVKNGMVCVGKKTWIKVVTVGDCMTPDVASIVENWFKM